MSRHLVFAATLACGLFGAAAWADTANYVTPSVAVGAVYDDNLFSAPVNRQSDEILRISPALEAGYGSDSLTIAGYYTVDAERYRRHSYLNGNTVRRNAALDFNYLATPRLTFGLGAEYTATETPAELSPQTSLALGRAHAVYSTVSPSVSYIFSDLTDGKLGYTHSHQELADRPDTNTNTATLGFDHKFDPRDTLDAELETTRYDFGPVGFVNSRALTVGWTRALTPDLSVRLAGGPRDTGGDYSGDYAADLRWLLDAGTFTMDYARSETALLGETQPVDTRSLTARLDYNFGQYVSMEIAPSYSRDAVGTARANLYRFNVSLSYELSRITSLVGSYQYSLQRGLLTGADTVIHDNIIYVGLVFSRPSPGESAFTERHRTPFETLWPAPRSEQIPATTTEQDNETPP